MDANKEKALEAALGQIERQFGKELLCAWVKISEKQYHPYLQVH